MSGSLKIIADEHDPRWIEIARHTDTEIFGFFGEYLFLSNFWSVEVIVDDVTYPTAENAYQAAKFIEEKRKSFASLAPGVAKLQGQFLDDRLYQKDGWDKVKVMVMKQVLTEKFKNPVLKSKLIETGDKEIIEANWWGDTFWGVYVDEQGNEMGENLLGKCIMEVRAELKKNLL